MVCCLMMIPKAIKASKAKKEKKKVRFNYIYYPTTFICRGIFISPSVYIHWVGVIS